MTSPTTWLGLHQIFPVTPEQVCEKHLSPVQAGLISLNNQDRYRLRKNVIFPFLQKYLRLRIRLVEDVFLVYPLGHQMRTKGDH